MRVYVGVHWLCKLAVSLAMLWHSGTAAVWLGAQTPHRTAWVQAGIASMDGRVFLYVERKAPDQAQPTSQFYPWSLDRTARARLERRGRSWRARIGPLRTRWLPLRDVRWCNALELQGGAHAGAVVGFRYVRG